MRSYIFFVLLFIINNLNSQNTTEKALYIPYDSTLGYSYKLTLPENTPQNQLLYRITHKNSTKTKYEYIKYKNDTLVFFEYDTTSFLKIIKHGYVYLSDECPRHDTTTYYKNNDYKDLAIRVILNCTPLKHGFWKETYGDSCQISGYYVHGKKQGVWDYRNYKDFNIDYRTFKNDTIIKVSHYNALKTNNIDTIKTYIPFRFQKSKNLNVFIKLENNFVDNYNDTYIFNSDMTITVERANETEKGKWDITPQYLNIIFDNGKTEIYKLRSVSENGISFEK